MEAAGIEPERRDPANYPTLLIQAQDDPFVPFDAHRDRSIATNPAVDLLATDRGGHTEFWGRAGVDSDRFWAEHRSLKFLAQQT